MKKVKLQIDYVIPLLDCFYKYLDCFGRPNPVAQKAWFLPSVRRGYFIFVFKKKTFHSYNL